MMALRAREKALAIGDLQELPTDRRKPVFAALRTSEDGTERAVTVFNFSAAAVPGAGARWERGSACAAQLPQRRGDRG